MGAFPQPAAAPAGHGGHRSTPSAAGGQLLLWGAGGGLPGPGGPCLLSGSCAQPSCPPSAGISLIMWNALYTAEKVIIRWSLLTEACYFAVQFLGERLQPLRTSRRRERLGVCTADPHGAERRER